MPQSLREPRSGSYLHSKRPSAPAEPKTFWSSGAGETWQGSRHLFSPRFRLHNHHVGARGQLPHNVPTGPATKPDVRRPRQARNSGPALLDSLPACRKRWRKSRAHLPHRPTGLKWFIQPKPMFVDCSISLQNPSGSRSCRAFAAFNRFYVTLRRSSCPFAPLARYTARTSSRSQVCGRKPRGNALSAKRGGKSVPQGQNNPLGPPNPATAIGELQVGHILRPSSRPTTVLQLEAWPGRISSIILYHPLSSIKSNKIQDLWQICRRSLWLSWLLLPHASS